MCCGMTRGYLQRSLRLLGRPHAPVLSSMRSTAPVTAAALRTLATPGETPKGKRWDNVKEWVMFSDLHVSVKSLHVCIAVLRKVKKEAAARKAGVLFLGQCMHVQRGRRTQKSTIAVQSDWTSCAA